MINFLRYITVIALLIIFTGTAHAQKRADETTPADYSGPIIKKKDPSVGANLGNLFNVKMSQSFSASFTSFGGHAANVEAFTNSARFFFSKNLTGQLDISLLTSPFGLNDFAGYQNHNNLQVALDAQLNYQISKNLDLHLEVNRGPAGYGYGYYPGRFGPIHERSYWDY